MEKANSEISPWSGDGHSQELSWHVQNIFHVQILDITGLMKFQINGLSQECNNFITNTLELLIVALGHGNETL